MSHPIRRLATLQSDVFLLNSQPGLFTVTQQGSIYATSPFGHLLSRSYEVILPSSLRRVLSSAFPYSGYLPVLVYGTIGHDTLFKGFSRQCGISDFAIAVAQAPYHLSPDISVELRV